MTVEESTVTIELSVAVTVSASDWEFALGESTREDVTRYIERAIVTAGVFSEGKVRHEIRVRLLPFTQILPHVRNSQRHHSREV